MASNGTNSSAPTTTLSAMYTSPTNEHFTFSQALTQPATSSPADRVACLASLRAAALALQEHVNAELTARMEADKALTTAAAADVKEEENYGEELPQEE